MKKTDQTAEGRVKCKTAPSVGVNFSLDFEYLINDYDGCERP